MTTAGPRLGAEVLDDLDRRLAPVDAELAARYPGDPGTRQPVHAVYVPADRMTPGVPANWGALALATLKEHAPGAASLAEATGLDPALVHAAGGRCAGLHYGTCDYSAACGIAAAYQSLEHPVADHAKAVMQVAAARLRAWLERTGGGVLDEPATAQALAGFLARGLDCGALTEAEVTERSGLDRAAIGGWTRGGR